MSIHIRCAKCDAEFDVPESFAGKQGKCPECGQVMTAPKAAPAPAPARAASKSSPALPRAKALPADEPVVPRIDPTASNPNLPGLVLNNPTRSSKPAIPEKHPQEGLPGWVWGVVGGSGVAVIAAIAIVVWALNSGGPTVAAGPGKNQKATNPAQPKKPAGEPVRKRPEPADTALVGKGPDSEWNKTKIAHNMEEVTAAMVKIMFPTGGEGAILGSGFLIDKRGWVATNYHVIEKANSAIRCYMNDGKSYAVEGLLSQDRERDLAIIKLKDMPFQMTILDMSNFGDPQIGTEIFCYGHPHGVDFSLSQGVVGRVCATNKLDASAQNFLYSSHNTPDDMVWIQVDAKINPGNSGGPLIDKKSLKVWGVNSWVNREVGFGYASHVQYLRDLAQRTTDTAKEFPKPEKTPEFAGVSPLPDNFSAQMLEEHTANCEKFNWIPGAKADDTTAILEFARLMHGAREIARHPDAAEKISEEENRKINAAATAAWQKLCALEWTDERIAAVNKVAAKTMEKAGFGVLAVCECVAPEGNGPLLKLIGTEKNIFAGADAPGIFTNGSRVLVIGLASPVNLQMRMPGSSPISARIVKSHFTRVIKEK